MKKQLLAGLIACLLISVTAWAAEKTFVVGVENIVYMPYSLYNAVSGEYQGFARTLLDEFAEQNGYTFEYKALPVKRLYKYFLEKKVDFKYPDSPNWNTDGKKGHTIVYSDDVVEYIDGLMVLPANKGKGIDGIKRIGIIRGFTPWDYLDLVKAQKVTVHEVDRMSGLIKLVLKNRTNGAYTSVAVANHTLNRIMKKPGAIVYDQSLPHSSGSYKLSTIQHPEIMTKFNNFLKNQAAKVLQIKKQYSLDKIE